MHNNIAKMFVLVVMVGFGLGVGFLLFRKPTTHHLTPSSAHYHAGFQIYVDDVLQDFSGLEYMETAPCGVPGQEVKEAESHALDLHNGVGDVVHVHAAGTTWNDLLVYLQEHQQFAPENLSVKGVMGYVNGEGQMDIRDQLIKPYDSAVIIIGYALGEIEDKLAVAVKQPQILEAEAQKENCGL